MYTASVNTRSRVPPVVWFIGLAGLFAAPFTPNPALTTFAVLLVPGLFLMLWRPGEAPILLFAAGIQWLQATTKIFHANAFGVEISQLFFGSTAIEQAAFYSMSGLIALVVGMRIGAGNPKPVHGYQPGQPAGEINIDGVWKGYLLASAAGVLIGNFAWSVPGLTQALLKLADLRFIVLFVLIYAVVKQDRGQLYVVLALTVEVAVGFLGYFSEFKGVFYVFLLAYLSARPRLHRPDYLMVAVVTVGLITLSLFWTSIKGEYREFLSGGKKAQIVTVNVGERVNWISGAALRTDLNTLQKAMVDLAERTAYVDFFGHVIRRIPTYQPHENGAVWGAAIQHVTTPRLFFPNKPVLPSDSEQTMKYTGLYMASDQQGTSISIGYMGESYIDFGFPGMLFPILLVGIMWGVIYRFFMNHRPLTIFNQAAAVYVLLGASLLEMHTVKLLGGVIMSFLVVVLLMKFVLPRFLPRFIRLPRTNV